MIDDCNNVVHVHDVRHEVAETCSKDGRVACASKFPLPLSSTALQMLKQARTAGLAKEEDSADIKIFPGLELSKGKA